MPDTPIKDIRLYTRDRKGTPTGLLIAMPSKIPGHKYHIGWSKAKVNEDRFNRTMALQIAVGRLEAAENDQKEIVETSMPHQIRALLPRFQDRCKRYFK